MTSIRVDPVVLASQSYVLGVELRERATTTTKNATNVRIEWHYLWLFSEPGWLKAILLVMLCPRKLFFSILSPKPKNAIVSTQFTSIFFHKSLHVNSSFDTTLFPRYGRSIIHLFALTSIKIQIHVSTEMCNCTKWVWDSLWNGIANKAVFTFNPSWIFFLIWFRWYVSVAFRLVITCELIMSDDLWIIWHLSLCYAHNLQSTVGCWRWGGK